ncbi:hypothetical protein ACFRAE_00300 [Sphingobacterium sp. HJSM2_6]|uniref:hypothetical protein n=1 Tax=Sphingobacterium sp. HJSM2_6 TaxID=3366264 RepID=UPI003BCF9CA0
MNLQRILLNIAFLLFSMPFAIGQQVEIMEQIPISEKSTEKNFELLTKSFPISQQQKIGTLRGTFPHAENQQIIKLFNLFWKNANKLGANSFVVEDIQIVNDSTAIRINLYQLSEEDLKSNEGLYPHNMVYMIGELTNDQEGKNFRFNEVKVNLKPMSYIAYQNEVGKEATVGVGGLLGAKTWIRGKEGRPPIFYSLSGFGVGPGIATPISLSFNTGRLNPVLQNFGQFLLLLLNEQKL